MFLDDRHQYSIRAFTYQGKPRALFSVLVSMLRGSGTGPGTPGPLPPLAVDHLVTELGLDRLSIHQTASDTTIVVKETDKGVGLTALRDWVLGPDAERAELTEMLQRHEKIVLKPLAGGSSRGLFFLDRGSAIPVVDNEGAQAAMGEPRGGAKPAGAGTDHDSIEPGNRHPTSRRVPRG